MAKRKLRLELVYIEWVDAAGREGWENIDRVLKMKFDDPVKTVGHILKETDDLLIITGSHDEHNDTCLSYIMIPKIMIQKRMGVELIENGNPTI